MTATTRKTIGMLGLIAGLGIYALIVGAILGAIGRLPMAAEVMVYAVLGIIWIIPARTLFVWMETGRWKLDADAKR